MTKSKLIAKNLIYGFGTRILTLILGIILPKIIIESFGSEINGFLSTITQIFTYFALLEAGIGNSAVNALYKPLKENDHIESNIVMNQARRYYRRSTLVYALLVALFAVVYPLVTDSTMSKISMILIILLQGASHVLGYYFCTVYEQLLVADGKKYISENTSFFLSVSTNVSKIVLVLLGCDIILVQVAHFIIALIRVPVIRLYCSKNYKWLTFKGESDEKRLHERSAFVIHEVSSAVFYNTDVFIISLFCGFSAASVYAVYNMIYSALNSMMNTANAGLGFVLGQSLDEGNDKLIKIYDIYSTLYSAAVFAVYTVALILTIPFMRLYTQDITDVNYIISGLPILFALSNLMSGVRAVPARLITVSGHARNTQLRSIIETIINIVSSVLLVSLLGIYGVLLGTCAALLYRMNDIIIYANKKILKRSPVKEYRGILTNLGAFLAFAFIVNFLIHINVTNYVEFLAYGAILTIASAAVYISIAVLKNKDLLRFLKSKIKSKR